MVTHLIHGNLNVFKILEKTVLFGILQPIIQQVFN